jgi:hypothetical protein
VATGLETNAVGVALAGVVVRHRPWRVRSVVLATGDIEVPRETAKRLKLA